MILGTFFKAALTCSKLLMTLPHVGVASAVFRGDELLWQRTSGYAHRQEETAVTEHTNFNLASLSKAFTALLIWQLQRQQALDLNAPLNSVLPDLPAWAAKITIRDLVFHTSGLPDYFDLVAPQGDIGTPQVIEALARLPQLQFPPGSQFAYSNTGYALLSEVITRASGRKFSDLLEKNIFQSAGMSKSFLFTHDTQDRITLGATGYEGAFFPRINNRDRMDFVVGDGSIHSNLLDYRKWINGLESGVFTDLTDMHELFRAGTLRDGSSLNYAYGWMIGQADGHRMIFHTGSWLGFRSAVIFFPEKKLWSVVFANNAAYEARARALHNAAPFLR